jgi:alpha-glucosidase
MQRVDAGSILNLYRQLLALRSASPALQRGDFQELDAPDKLLAYRRQSDQDTRIVLINFSDDPVEVAPDSELGRTLKAMSIELASDGASGGFPGRLEADQALLLR